MNKEKYYDMTNVAYDAVVSNMGDGLKVIAESDEFAIHSTGTNREIIGYIENKTNDLQEIHFSDDLDIEPFFVESGSWRAIPSTEKGYAKMGALLSGEFEAYGPDIGLNRNDDVGL